MTDLPAYRVAEVFVEFADTLVEGFDLIDFLQRLTERTSEMSSNTTAGLLLMDADGRLRFVAASDERTHLLELFQVQSHEGPCRDCSLSGRRVDVADLSEQGTRWPSFTLRALSAGFRSIHAFPLRLRETVIGAMGVFSTEPGQMDESLARVVQALTDIATISILQEQALRRSEVLAEQLQGALNSRVVVEQAKGAIAQSYGVTVDEAFVLLRDHVRRHGLRLTDVAQAVVSDPTRALGPGTATPTATEQRRPRG